LIAPSIASAPLLVKNTRVRCLGAWQPAVESGFMENTAAVSLRGRLSLEPAYDNGVYRVKAEVLTGIKIIWQYCREIGNNLFVPQEKIVEIRGHVLTGIQRKLIGHAARAYVP